MLPLVAHQESQKKKKKASLRGGRAGQQALREYLQYVFISLFVFKPFIPFST